jgi:hypothetical protein
MEGLKGIIQLDGLNSDSSRNLDEKGKRNKQSNEAPRIE